jgi:hypothetical protein
MKTQEKLHKKLQESETSSDTGGFSREWMTTPGAGSVEVNTGPRCRPWKATGSSANSAEYGTAKNVLEQATGRCSLIENVTDSNSSAIV